MPEYKNITDQYSESYEYRDLLQELNKQAALYYRRLHQTLPATRAAQAPSAPVFYIEAESTALAKLLVLGNSASPLISIPDVERSGPILTYGTARTFSEHHPEILAELAALIQNHFPERSVMMTGLLGDVVAKLAAIVLLFNPEKVSEYLSNPVTPQMDQPDTTIKPTLALLSPYIGFQCIRFLFSALKGKEGVDETASEQKIEQIIAGLDDLLEEYLDKPCAPLIDIQSGSVRDMRDALLDMIRLILSDEVSLKSLGGQSLLDFLVACIEQKSEEDVSPGINVHQFLKNLPDTLSSAQIIPLPFSISSGIKMAGAPDFFIEALLALLAILL
jgi:hypothetical protein